MSRINRVRFVNFTYNDNRHIYDQTFNFYGGENTLLNLQNGGGKTVLVQMMLQPISPKQKLKDRLFKSYFMKSIAPTYIMIEWELDNDSGYVLTGIGIKKVSGKNIDDEENDNIKIITFISEYKRKNPFDIDSINLTYTENEIVKLTDFDKVIKSLSNAEKNSDYKVKLFRWEQTEDKKKYIEELAAYKIYQSEWKNLMVKINETEAGLNSFFSDCKTNKALIKTWFIPTIEEQLNKNGKVIDNIRELIKNHAEHLVKNEKIIQEKSIFEDFKVKSKQVIDSLEKYDQTLKDIKEMENSIGNLYAFLTNKATELNTQKENIMNAIGSIENAIKEVLYDKLSYEYHEINSELSDLQSQVSQLDNENRALLIQIDENKHKEKVQLCAELYQKLQGVEGNIIKYRAELDKLEMEQEEINKKIADISYTLGIKYKEKVDNDQLALAAQEALREEKINAFNANKNEITNKRKAIEDLNNERLKIIARISDFESKEKEIQKRYNDFKLQRNFFTGEYDNKEVVQYQNALNLKVEENKKLIVNLSSEKVRNETKITELEGQISSLNAQITDNTVKLNEKKSQYKEFAGQKEKILKIINDYQLNEDYLFEREKIISVLSREISHYNSLTTEKNTENSDIEKKLNMYETGKSIELTEELQRAFEDNNIDIDFGFEWIKNYSVSQEEKEKLLQKNPFIPFSIIISRRDFERLKNLDLKVFTSDTLPLIERESLEEKLKIVWTNQVVTFDKMSFILSFNNDLLDEEHLNSIIKELIRIKNYNQGLIDNAQESINTLQGKIVFVNSFTYSPGQVAELEYSLKNLEGLLGEKTALHSELQIQIRDLRDKFSNIGKELAQKENEKDALARQCEDIENLLHKYPVYLEYKAKESNTNGQIKNMNHEISTLDGKNDVLQEEISDLRIKISKLTELLDGSKEKLAKYNIYKTGILRTGEISALENELSALDSQLGGDIKLYKELLGNSNKEKTDLEGKIAKHEIPEVDYKGVTFDKAELKNIEQTVKELTGKNAVVLNRLNDIKVESGKVEERLRNKRDKIIEECDGRLPKHPEHIGDINFSKRKSELLQQKSDLQRSQAAVESEAKAIGIELASLSEFEVFVNRITAVDPIKEDFVSYRKQIISNYRMLIENERTQKDSLITEYDKLENGFINKAEIFRQLFTNLLNDEKRYRLDYGANALERANLQIDRKLEQYSIDIQKMSDMESHIVNSTFGYVRNVYDEMDSIDKNSAIEIEGQKRKMLIVSLPAKDKLEEGILKEYIKGTINNCVSLYKQDKPMDNLLTNEINTFDLFDRLVGINKVEIILLKIEPNAVKKKTWKQVIEETSGGEKFVSAFVVFISLLTYMRGSSILKINEDSKVLIMDNPFGPITSEHLLKPLFDIAKKYNTQLICLSDLKEHTIYDRFNLVYALNIEKEAGRDEEYIEVKIIKKDVEKNSLEHEVLTSSMFKIQQQSLFDLIKQDFKQI